MAPEEYVIDIQQLRKSLGLSQVEFSENYGIPLDSLKNWEQDHRFPNGAARSYFMAISEDPHAVRKAYLRAKEKLS